VCDVIAQHNSCYISTDDDDDVSDTRYSNGGDDEYDDATAPLRGASLL